MGKVQVTLLEFGQPVPPGGFLIPYPRKTDGTADRLAGLNGAGKAIQEAASKGHKQIFVETSPRDA